MTWTEPGSVEMKNTDEDSIQICLYLRAIESVRNLILHFNNKTIKADY